MAKKLIAAVLLVTIAAWAEMALAPMLAMHAGHMRPGHEMAADMPADRAGHNQTGHHHSARHQAEHEQATAEGRPCCPGLHKVEPADVLELVSGSPACDDPHSCCFGQGPQSVPAPVRAVQGGVRRNLQRLARAMAPAAVVQVSPARAPAGRADSDRALALSSPPEVFGMTLRV